MSGTEQELAGPDLTLGVPLEEIADGALLLGHAAGDAVLLARRGDEVFALGAHCTHYGAPLIDGLLVGDTVRCPWHHACFHARSGAPLRAWKQAWCQGQRTVSPTSRPSISGAP